MPPSSQPLQLSGPKALLNSEVVKSEYQGTASTNTFHLFINQTDTEVELYWFYEGGEHKQASIPPNGNAYIGTHTFHQWKVLGPEGRLLGVYQGESACITVSPRGCQIQVNGLPPGQLSASGASCVAIETPEGTYRKRGEALGMAIWAFDCVGDTAVARMTELTSRLLADSPDWVLERMRAAGAALAIIGRDQGVTDLPPHQFMKHLQERDLDRTSRGLGATLTVPVTSVGEENLTHEDDWLYPCQSIFVHEMGHAVLNLAMDAASQRRLCDAYESASTSQLYQPGIYMMVNEQEYFATGAEAWFESTVRTDINGGLNTREKLKAKDPKLAQLLAEAYGDGSWRYVHDCPTPLRMPTKHDREMLANKPVPAARQPPMQRSSASLLPANGASSSGDRGQQAEAAAGSRRRSSCWDALSLCGGSQGRPAKIPRLGWRAAWGLPGCLCLTCGTLDGLSGCLPCTGWCVPGKHDKDKQ